MDDVTEFDWEQIYKKEAVRHLSQVRVSRREMPPPREVKGLHIVAQNVQCKFRRSLDIECWLRQAAEEKLLPDIAFFHRG